MDLEINFFDLSRLGHKKATRTIFLVTANNGSFNLEIVIADSDIPAVLDSSTDTYIEVTDTTNSKSIQDKNKLSTLLQQAGGIAGVSTHIFSCKWADAV